MTRPRLKSRRIPGHSRKPAIMQPIKHLLLLSQSRISLAVLWPHRMRSQRQPLPLLRRRGMVRFDPAAPDEEQIADFDVPAQRFRSDVNTLRFAALVQLGVADGVVVVAVVGDVVGVRVAAVVEQDAPACDPVLGPVVDGAFVVGVWAEDVAGLGVVVEGAGWDVGELGDVSGVFGCWRRGGWRTDMSEAVPLGARLGVHGVWELSLVKVFRVEV